MDTLRRFFDRYFHFVHAALGSPGIVAFASVFGIGFADAVIPIPGGMDGLIAAAVLSTGGNHLIVAAYIVAAAVGNSLGNIILYAIGYKGGEVFLEKRLGKERFERMRAKFEKREVLTLMLGAMMPPPFPFKTLVLSAAVFEVNLPRFLLGILLGRALRFSILAALVLTFGPQVITVFSTLLRRHMLAMLLIIAAAIALALFLYWRKRQKRADSPLQTKRPVPLGTGPISEKELPRQ